MAPKGPIEPIACPRCNVSFKKTTFFEQHLVDDHDTTAQALWRELHGKTTCRCGCQKETAWQGWKKGYATCIIGHNAAIHAYYDENEASRLAETRRQSMKKNAGWSRGLSKETDERIAERARRTSIGKKNAFKNGTNVAWNKGGTKESDPRIAAGAETLRDMYKSGELVPWTKDLTKETDSRVAAMAARVSIKLNEDIIRQRLDQLKRLSSDEITKRINSTGKLTLVSGLDQYINDRTRSLVVRCNNCGKEQHVSLVFGQSGRCFYCSPGGSIGQTNLLDFVRSIVGIDSVTLNNRRIISPQEIDIYCEDLKFGIEYNGLFFHSEVNKPSMYHSAKSEACQKLGISLFHVFEDEWRDKRQIVKSIIKAKLGLLTHRVYARSCRVVELSKTERRTFFEANHLDGNVTAEAAWGLVDSSNNVVYALSVRKPFHKSIAKKLEVARTCPSLETIVPGGLSRLTSAALQHARTNGYSSLMTYVDERLGGKASYVAAGWQLTSKTSPRFWWTDFENRFNRFKFKADKEAGMSEAQVAAEVGVVKIWGCKNAVYEIAV